MARVFPRHPCLRLSRGASLGARAGKPSPCPPWLSHAAAGAGFGLCFPLVAWAIDLLHRGADPSWAALLSLHEKNPIHAIVDLAPLVLGFAGYIVGVRETRIRSMNDALEARVRERTAALERALDDAKDAREDLRAAKERAEAALSARTTFLAAMSHELRTPLVGVVGWLELLERRDGRTREVALARRSASALLDVIGSVLDFAKIDSGKLDLRTAPFEPVILAEAVRDLFAPTAAAKGIDLRLGWDGSLSGRWFESDPARLLQVLRNLVGNAVKFTERGWVELWVGEGSGGILAFRIEDTGSGIPAESLARVFEPFEQVDGTTTRPHGGTGLGLSISRDIVHGLEGQIFVESQIGVGSVFRVEVPAHPISAPTGRRSDAAHTPVRRLRVLLAEDNNLNAEVILAQLDALGVDAERVDNGQLALERALAGPFDLILMDHHMPVLDGVEATRRLRSSASSRAQTPVVAMTASAVEAEHSVFGPAGMDGLLLKPATLQQLSEVLFRYSDAAPHPESSPVTRRAPPDRTGQRPRSGSTASSVDSKGPSDPFLPENETISSVGLRPSSGDALGQGDPVR